MSNYDADANPDLTTARRLAFSFGFAPQTDLKIDQFSTLTTDKVFTLVRKIGSTRLKILVDPNEI